MNTRMLLLLVLLALFLVACGAQGPQQEEPSGEEPGEVTRVVTETVVEEGEAVEVTRIATESPAEEAEEPPASPPPEESPTSPAPAATPIATQERPPATPPALEHRAEVEWPPRMRLGESDVVRLSLLPSEDGYVVATDFPEHRTVTETVTLEQLAGYEMLAVARLDGVGFDLSPQGEQPQDWQPDRPLTWRWTVSPRNTGQQRLSVNLLIQWRPEPGRSLPSR